MIHKPPAYVSCCKNSTWNDEAKPDNKVYGANMEPTWGRQDPLGPHVGPINFAIWVSYPTWSCGEPTHRCTDTSASLNDRNICLTFSRDHDLSKRSISQIVVSLCYQNNCDVLAYFFLTHWGRVTHICVVKLTIIGSDNGLSPKRRQAIIWTNSGILLIGPLGTNFSEILIGIQIFSFKKMYLKMSSAKWSPFVSASIC